MLCVTCKYTLWRSWVCVALTSVTCLTPTEYAHNADQNGGRREARQFSWRITFASRASRQTPSLRECQHTRKYETSSRWQLCSCSNYLTTLYEPRGLWWFEPFPQGNSRSIASQKWQRCQFCLFSARFFPDTLSMLTGYLFAGTAGRSTQRQTVYSRLPITRTFKGNRKKFELSGVRVIGSSKKIA